MTKQTPMPFGLTEEQKGILEEEAKRHASHMLAIRGDVYSNTTEMENAWDAEYMAALTRFKASDDIEGIIQRHVERAGQASSDELTIEYAIRNNEPTYGLRKEDMGQFRSSIPGNDALLESIYYGMHNIDIPHSILELMNTQVIMALYAGIGILKRNNGHKTNPVSYETAEELISAILGIGFKSRAINRMKGKGFSGHNIGIKERLSLVSEGDKQAFIESFEAKYVSSLRESKAYGQFVDYSQPEEGERENMLTKPGINEGNVDAVMQKNIRSRYITGICNTLGLIYEANAKP